MNEPIVWRWTRFVIGVILLVGFVAVHVLLKELPSLILAAPLALIGFDAADIFKSMTGGKK